MTAVDGAIKAGIDLLVPVRRCRVVEPLAQHEAGIVDQNVQAPEVSLDARHHASDRFEIRDIRPVGLGLAAGLLDLRDHHFGFIFRGVIIHRDRRPRFGKGSRYPGTDISAATGNEGDAPCKIVHCWLPFAFMRALSSSLKIRSGVMGRIETSMSSGDTASQIALAIAAGAPIVPPSPIPRKPPATAEQLSIWTTSIKGTSTADGMT